MASGGDSGLPTTFSWRLGGDPRPSLFQAFPLGHAVRNAVMRAGNVIGLTRLPDALHGGPGRREHDHAYWLSEDRDGDGLIDHVTVHANSGLPQPVVAALAGAGSVWLDRAATWELIPWTMGWPGAEGLLGSARIWHAATAYVTPLWRTTPGGRERLGLDAEAQLRGELAARGIPAPVRIIWRKRMRVPGASLAPVGFVVSVLTRKAPADAFQGAPTLIFAEPVTGPLALGFGKHFGLGLMKPERPPRTMPTGLRP